MLLAGYAFVALQGPQGVPGLIEKRRLIREYEKKNAELARKIEEQRGRIGRSPTPLLVPEPEIRHRLMLVKPGEKVFMLQDAPAPSGSIQVTRSSFSPQSQHQAPPGAGQREPAGFTR